MRTIGCAHLIQDAATAPKRNAAIRIDGGTIAAVGPAKGTVAPLLAMPPLTNAHDHGRAIRMSSIGAGGYPLEAWLLYFALLPAVDPYLAAVVALGHAALGGVGTVMMHYTRVQGFTDLPQEVAEVARAARDVGVRVGFAVAMRDRHPLVYGPSEPILAALPESIRGEIARRLVFTPRSVAEQLAVVDAVAAAAGSPTFDVQYGPTGVQWCSDALLKGIAAASAETGRRVHMHLLETRYQRAWADAAFPDGVVRYLDDIGLLSPRLTLAHCVWARPDELEILAARGVTIALNTSSNLHLRSGIAPLGEMLRRGCRVALGIDGTALDEDDDALREMRLAHLLHVGTGFSTAVERETMLALAFENGHPAIMNADGGHIAPGLPADVLLVDWATLDEDRVRADLDPLTLLFARATKRHIHELIVAGRSIVAAGRVTGVDLDAARLTIREAMRRGLAADADFAAALRTLGAVVAHHYEPGAPCC